MINIISYDDVYPYNTNNSKRSPLLSEEGLLTLTTLGPALSSMNQSSWQQLVAHNEPHTIQPTDSTGCC